MEDLEDSFETLRRFELMEAHSALDFLATYWNHDYGTVSHDISAGEAAVLSASREEKFLRVVTGGWSDNEALLNVFLDTLIGKFTWRLSAAGGLHIFRYPR